METRLKSVVGFKKQVLTVMSGTAVAQAISLLLMPLLTRLFTPSDFGVFAIFNAVVSIWSLVATFRLENAILIPKKEEEAQGLLALGVWCGVFSCILLYFCLRFFALFVGQYFGAFGEIVHDNALLIATNCFLLGFCNLLVQWHNRHARFHISAQRVILDRVSFMALALSLAQFGARGLIFAQLLSVALLLIYLLFVSRRGLAFKTSLNWIHQWQLLKAYRHFSLKHGAGTLVQVAAWQLPPILISAWFPINLVGKYNLATRILEAPLYLVGNSFSGVFYRKLSHTDVKHWKSLIARTIKPLLFIPPLPLFVFCIFAPQIFAFAFGEAWLDSGRFFAILSFLYWWRLIYIAMSPSYLVLNRLGTDLIFSTLLLLSQMISVYMGFRIFHDLSAILVLMSALTSMVIIASVTWVYRETSKRSLA